MDVWPRHRYFVPGLAAAREPGSRVRRRGSGRRVNREHDAQSPARGSGPKGGRPLGGPANRAGGDIHGLTGGRTSDCKTSHGELGPGQGLGLETPRRPPLGPSPEVRPSTNTLVQGACLVWKSRPAPEKLSRPPCPPKDQAHPAPLSAAPTVPVLLPSEPCHTLSPLRLPGSCSLTGGHLLRIHLLKAKASPLLPHPRWLHSPLHSRASSCRSQSPHRCPDTPLLSSSDGLGFFHGDPEAL